MFISFNCYEKSFAKPPSAIAITFFSGAADLKLCYVHIKTNLH